MLQTDSASQLRASAEASPPGSEHRLLRAERRGLRIAILCRTIAVGIGVLWILLGWVAAGFSPNVWAVFALVGFTAFGIFNYLVIGTRLDRWWLKYAMSAADVLGVCAVFALVPLSRGGDIPQVVAFQAYGIYFLFPLVVLPTLSLSWKLVLWTGVIAVAGWWLAFAISIRDMERRLSWDDLPIGATREQYEEILLSVDFIGVGSRIQETGLLLIAASIVALAVYRARRVFFAQLAAEAEREAERAARERIAERLGRYVPKAVAERLMADEAALAPQVRHGAVLVMDVQGFSSFAATRDPKEVIATLNEFLAGCAETVEASDGVVISFTGDGLMATFNTPIEIEGPERAALRTAYDLIERAGDSSFAIRVGLAAGAMASGSVGSSKRQAFTVYGDTVNRAARLETLAAKLGERILVDAAIAEAAAGTAELRALGRHDLKGLAEPVAVSAG